MEKLPGLPLSQAVRKNEFGKQLTDSNYHDGWSKIRTRPGPFSSSLRYYANLLQESWSEVQKTLPESEDAGLRWKIHAYLWSLLASYVKPVKYEFVLAHTDLNSSNLLVDPKTGSVTGIIDWEFACTVPFQAPEHFSVLLQRDAFMDDLGDVFDQ
jgi:Phosphotransferase enzyme family